MKAYVVYGDETPIPTYFTTQELADTYIAEQTALYRQMIRIPEVVTPEWRVYEIDILEEVPVNIEFEEIKTALNKLTLDEIHRLGYVNYLPPEFNV